MSTLMLAARSTFSELLTGGASNLPESLYRFQTLWGFNSFYNTVVELMQKNDLKEVMVGIELTGYYWYDFGQFMNGKK
ncbi:hypothetical protein AALA78_03185 [Lachnospiraceae bacterium 42-17]